MTARGRRAALALGLAALVGCTGQPPAAPSTPTPSPTIAAPSTAESAGPDTEARPFTVRGVGWRDWRPVKPVALTPISDEEADRRIDGYLELMAAGFDVSLGDLPARVRTVPPSQLGATLAQCSTDAGFPAVQQADGRVTSDQPDAPGRARAELDCAATYPPDPRFLGDPQDPAILAAVWEYYDTFVIPCLAAHRVQPHTALPGREQFLADPVWEPCPQYLSPLQLQVLEAHCPATPPYEAVGG